MIRSLSRSRNRRLGLIRNPKGSSYRRSKDHRLWRTFIQTSTKYPINCQEMAQLKDDVVILMNTRSTVTKKLPCSWSHHRLLIRNLNRVTRCSNKDWMISLFEKRDTNKETIQKTLTHPIIWKIDGMTTWKIFMNQEHISVTSQMRWKREVVKTPIFRGIATQSL